MSPTDPLRVTDSLSWGNERAAIYRPERLAGVDPERLAAGGEDAHSFGCMQQRLGNPCRGIDQVLAIVDDQQTRRCTNCRRDPVEQ